jgi:hypothetical protein
MEATASSASLYTLRGSYEYPDKSQKPQYYLGIHPKGAQAGAEWLTGYILNSDQNLKISCDGCCPANLLIYLPSVMKLFPTHTVNA